MLNRQEWIDRLCQSHWNDDEVASGEAWKFLRERLNLYRNIT